MTHINKYHNNNNPDIPYQYVGNVWYLLPIFLSIVGGVIAYILLRNRDPRKARSTLLMGIGIFVLFIAFVIVLGTQTPEHADLIPLFQYVKIVGNTLRILNLNIVVPVKAEIATLTKSIAPEHAEPNSVVPVATGIVDENQDTVTKMSVAAIKDQAMEVPYELLVEYNDAYVGDIIHYTGHVVGVLNNDDKSYALKVEVYDTDDRVLAQDMLIWSNYTPSTDKERKMISHIAGNSGGVFTFASSDNAVNVWATLSGIRDFNIMFDTSKIPESRVLILEMLAEGSISDSMDPVLEPATHTISYDHIPDYVDASVVTAALEDAAHAWETDNPSINFEIVQGDADIKIRWSQWMPNDLLGKYSSFNTMLGNKTVTKHEINIRLGQDDCSSNYQQFSHGILKHTIAHEIGHYLGLRHIDDPNNLMYADGFLDDMTDDIFSYQRQGYTIPTIAKADHKFIITENLLQQIQQIKNELATAMEERANLKNTDSVNRSMLDSNKEKINLLTQNMAILEDQMQCIGESETLWNILSKIS